MAIEDTLNKRIDALDSAQQLKTNIDKSIATEELPETQKNGIDTVMSPTESVILEDQEVKVAGLKDVVPTIFKKDAKKNQKAVEEREKRMKFYEERYKPKPSENDYVIQPYGIETAEDVGNILESAKKQPTAGKPGDLKGVKGKKPKYVATNLNMIDGPDSLKQFIGEVGDAYQVTKEKVSTKAIIEDLTKPRFYAHKKDGTTKVFNTEEEATAFINKSGTPDDFEITGRRPYTKKYLDKILDPKNPTLADPKFVGDMLVTQLDLTQQTERLANQINNLRLADKPIPDDMIIEFDQLFALTGEVHKAVSNRTSDIGRSLQIFGQLRGASGTETMFKEYFGKTGGKEMSIKTAKRFLELKNTEDKARMATNLWSLKSSPRMAKDIIYATWINGLLSSPITHLKNIIGNLTFGALRSPELFVSSIISKGRKGIGLNYGDDSLVEMQEAWDYASGYFGAMGDGLRLAFKGRKGNSKYASGSKVEYTSPQDAFDINFGEGKTADFMSKALKVYGKIVQVPGEMLMREDEFFKAMGYRGGYDQLAKIKYRQRKRELIEQGIDPADAKKQADDYLANLYDNPDPDMVKEAVDLSEELTFTKDLDGVMAKIQKQINYGYASPVLKMFFPFVRTPTNIAMKIAERSPLALTMPSFYRAMSKGGREADIALGKLSVGTGVLGTMSYQVGLSGMITGAGPRNYEQLKTWKAKGWQPFSFVLSKADVSDDLIKRYRDFTPVTVSGDKVYISYAGIQPIGAALAIAGTMGEYYQLTSKANAGGLISTENDGNIAEAGVLAATELFSQFPMLQGASELLDIVSAGGDFTGEQLYKFLEKSSQKAGEVLIGGSPLGVYSSLNATIERGLDPAASSYLPKEGGVVSDAMDYATHGFFKAFYKHASRIPFYSANVAPRLDPITGRPVDNSIDGFYENWNPLPKRSTTVGTGARVLGAAFPGSKTETQFSPAYEALIRFKVPMYTPPTTLSGYRLSDKQYNDWIYLATASGQLEDDILNAADRAEGMENLGKGQSLMKKAMSSRYKKALQELIEGYPDLAMHLENKDLEEEMSGNYSWY